MINLPDYWMQRPPMELDGLERSAFDELFARARSSGAERPIDYNLPYPKWQFLCYLADRHAIVLHGTGDADIRVFEPRKSMDLNEFGNRMAVYAAGDGLWAMYFAIIDRKRFPMTLTNACVRLADAEGNISEPRYVFSISRTALRHQPWRAGVVYLLPAETFEVQPPLPFGEYQVLVPQYASLVQVTPIARLEITPEDFPFLGSIRGHDDERLAQYAHAMQTGGPWPDSGE